jgi:hypothetical protein
MSPQFFRRYIDILESLQQDDLYQWSTDADVTEVDRTDELDFDPNDTFEEVIEKVRSNEDNRIGYGKYREGWHHPFNKQLVIKVAEPRDDNTIEECAQRNLWEFMVWHAANSSGAEEVKYLMPCEDIDPDGMWLTQRKGTRVPEGKEVPIKGAVDWIGDRKKENFAMLDDEYKSIDYGSKKALEHFNLPEDYNQARQVVADILAQTGAPVNDPNYGKSEIKPDVSAD